MPVITLIEVGKSYPVTAGGIRRLYQIISGKSPGFHEQVTVIEGIDLQVQRGEVLGIIGKNGAGKSTLLKIIAGMVPASTGSVEVNGRVTALLELGTGFHQDLTGRENIYLAAKLAGLSHREIDERYSEIVSFSGVGDYIDRPVKIYSSGMKVRLAFSVATSVDPDVLIIDEALSVGDGIFSSRSFQRIMEFKDRGKTIVFCSHAMHQVESLCDRVLWVDGGRVREEGDAERVTVAYRDFLRESSLSESSNSPGEQAIGHTLELLREGEYLERELGQERIDGVAPVSITDVRVSVDGKSGDLPELVSGKSSLRIETSFMVSGELPAPSLAVIVRAAGGMTASSATTFDDRWELEIDSEGRGEVVVEFPEVPLLKGRYTVDLYLMCENGIHVYEKNPSIATLQVVQSGLLRGLVAMPHHWM